MLSGRSLAPPAVGLAAASVVVFALLDLHRLNAGVSKTPAWLGDTPITVYGPAEDSTSLPVVVIAHGFAGSQQLMTSFAVTLARNGYLAVTFDFYGHGRSARALAGDVTQVKGATQFLLQQLANVVNHALALPAASGELAVLGHSMASDIIVRYAQSDPRVASTVAVSMFSPAVTAQSPRNLLMVVGELEGMLQTEALRVLGLSEVAPRAGVTYGTFSDGTARRAAIANNVEHVGVLYSRDSMRESLAWLDATFSKTTASTPDNPGYIDQRGVSIILLILGVCLGAWPLSKLLPKVSAPATGAALDWRGLLPVALIPGVGTPLLLWWFPADFLGVLVGGYLAMHFFVYGVLSAGALWWWQRYKRTSTSAVRGALHLPSAVIAAVLASGYAAVVVAMVLDRHVTAFTITPIRLPLVFFMLAGTLAYFLADEWITRGADTPQGAHVFTRACFLMSLGIAVALSFEDLFFLLIIGALILLYFLVYGLFSTWVYRATGHPAIGALANALAFAWALAAVFPMLSG